SVERLAACLTVVVCRLPYGERSERNARRVLTQRELGFSSVACFCVGYVWLDNRGNRLSHITLCHAEYCWERPCMGGLPFAEANRNTNRLVICLRFTPETCTPLTKERPGGVHCEQ